MNQILTARDKMALVVVVVSWIVCGVLAWIFRFPLSLMIALGVSWVWGQAVIRGDTH